MAKQVREEIAVEVTRMKDAIGIVPGLVVILVGSRKDSQTYVRNKKKACEAVGIKSYEVNLPEDSSEEEVIKHIASFNSDPSVHGILVQLPLPRVSVRLPQLDWLAYVTHRIGIWSCNSAASNHQLEYLSFTTLFCLLMICISLDSIWHARVTCFVHATPSSGFLNGRIFLWCTICFLILSY